MLQRITIATSNNLAFQLITRQAVGHQGLGQQQDFITDIHQRINRFRVYVERLVARNGPRRGGPNHDLYVFSDLWQRKCLRQLNQVSAIKADINGF